MRGIVLSGTNNLFIVLGEGGDRRLCALKGQRLRLGAESYNALAAGDRVEYEADPVSDRKGLVTALVPRRNVFGRFNEKGRSSQAIAANVDLVACVSSPRLPPFRPRFIDRVAVLAEAAHVPLLVVLNKCDLGFDEDLEDRLAEYQDLGYEVLPVSAATGEGLALLREAIDGQTCVFAGQSGVGKSSLLNALEPGLLRKVGEVSEKFNRGKHTTTMAELIPLADGRTWIADTPGVRRLALRGIEPASLDAYFPELAPLAPRCAYGLSCRHEEEEGCAVRAALAEGAIHEDRFESYLRIREELEANRGYGTERPAAPAAARPGKARGKPGFRRPGGGKPRHPDDYDPGHRKHDDDH
jgi:ribosome biogenesis GTPase